MHLWIAERLERNPHFFREAHLWKFGRDMGNHTDVLEFKICGIVPMYVRQYAEHIQGKESGNAVPSLQGADRGR